MTKFNINNLKTNPLNQEIYGDDDPQQFNELVEKIIKLSFEVVSGKVDEMYSRELGIDESVSDRIETIVAYLQSVGWTEEEFEQQVLFGILN